jgi:membrane associated rhomboid family serine protease
LSSQDGFDAPRLESRKKAIENRILRDYFHSDMLESRDYMRDRARRPPWSMTTIIVIALVAVYALQCINEVYIHSRIEAELVLTRDCFLHGKLWQLLTFQFLHTDILHLVFNLLSFWWVGQFVERVLGKKRFLIALFGSGAVGGAFQCLLMVLFPYHFGMAVVGASAGVCGILAIFAMIEKDSTILFSFVLPMRAITLVWILGAVSLFFILVPTREMGMAHAAHLGGLLAGVAWVKLGWHQDYVQLPWEGLWSRWTQWRPLRFRRRKQELVKTTSGRLRQWPGGSSESTGDVPSEEFISREVDPILDKISAHGIQSLTERERKILEAARSKMAKR